MPQHLIIRRVNLPFFGRIPSQRLSRHNAAYPLKDGHADQEKAQIAAQQIRVNAGATDKNEQKIVINQSGDEQEEIGAERGEEVGEEESEESYAAGEE
jgi:hypothetical protein